MKAPSTGDIGNRVRATLGGLERCPDRMQTYDAKVGKRSKTVRFPESATQRAIACVKLSTQVES